MNSQNTASNDAEVAFLMEQLLDEQEKVARLEDELARWKGASELKHAVESGTMLKASVESSALSDVNLQTLLSLRDSLTSSLHQIEKDIFRHATSTAQQSSVGTAVADNRSHDALASLRHALLRFRSVAELEQLYRTGIRIGYDVPRTMRQAMDRVLQLTNRWRVFHEEGSGVHSDNAATATAAAAAAAGTAGANDAPPPPDPHQPMQAFRVPSFCLRKEWRRPFHKAMTELVIAVDMKGTAKLPQGIWEDLRDVVAHEHHILQLLQRMAIADASEGTDNAGASDGERHPVTAATAATTTGMHSGRGVNGGRSTSSDSRQRGVVASKSGTVNRNRDACGGASNRTRSSSPKLKPTLQSISLPHKTSTSTSTTSATNTASLNGGDRNAAATPVAKGSTTPAGGARVLPTPTMERGRSPLAQCDASRNEEVINAPSLLLPPRAPQTSTMVSNTVCVEPTVVAAAAPRSRRVDPATPPSARIEGKPAAFSGARGISPVGRSTPSSMSGAVAVPRRVVLKSPSPKSSRRALSGKDGDSARETTNHGATSTAMATTSYSTISAPTADDERPVDVSDDDESAWDAFVERQERLHMLHHSGSGVGSAPKPRGLSSSPRQADMPAAAPKLSAEHTARRREPLATHTATMPPMCDGSVLSKQVRFSDDPV